MFDSVTELMLCSLNRVFFSSGHPEGLRFPVFTAVTWVISLHSRQGNKDRSDISHFFNLSSKTASNSPDCFFIGPLDAKDLMENYKALEHCEASRLGILTLFFGHVPFWSLDDCNESLLRKCLPSHPSSPALNVLTRFWGCLCSS